MMTDGVYVDAEATDINGNDHYLFISLPQW